MGLTLGLADLLTERRVSPWLIVPGWTLHQNVEDLMHDWHEGLSGDRDSAAPRGPRDPVPRGRTSRLELCYPFAPPRVCARRPAAAGIARDFVGSLIVDMLDTNALTGNNNQDKLQELQMLLRLLWLRR